MPYLKVKYERRALNKGETALDFYKHLKGRYGFLLKSMDRSGISYIGYDPFMVVYGQSEITASFILKNEFGLIKSSKRQILDGKPMEILAGLVRNFELKGSQPLAFSGGMFGYFSYDFLAKENGFNQSVYDELKVPDFVFCLVDKLVAVDYKNNEVVFISLAETETSCERKMEDLKRDVLRPIPPVRMNEIDDFNLNLNIKQYEERVARIKAMLKKNGVDSIDFSLQFKSEFTGELVDVIKKMKFAGETGYVFLFDCDDFAAGGKLRKGGEVIPVFNRAKATLIDQVEDYKRGLYGGVTGFYSFSGKKFFFENYESLYCRDNQILLQKGEEITEGSEAGGANRENYFHAPLNPKKS